MISYIKGNWLLLKFYLEHIPTILSLPDWMRNPDTLKQLFDTKTRDELKKPISLTLSAATMNRYNSAMDRLKAQMRTLHAGEKEMFSYKTELFLLFLFRLMCVLSAWHGTIQYTALFSMLQLLVAPYSLFVSFALCLALAPPIYAAHYIAFNMISSVGEILDSVLNLVGLSFHNTVGQYQIPISLRFIVVFFILDQALCFYCHYFTPSKKFSAKQTLVHLIWGFLNTKTYHLVLLLHMMNAGVSIPVWIWISDALLQVTPRISEIISRYGMHWLELFYHQHRMAHLPKVYEHAHKLHHYLHGTNAFDAHIYGNGMPEEYFFGILELAMGLRFGQFPASLNKYILKLSFDNKMGHTQKPEDTCGENFHADHHLLHNKNFGIYNCLMDMYFLTANHNDSYKMKPALYIQDGKDMVFDVERTHQDDQVIFTFNLR